MYQLFRFLILAVVIGLAGCSEHKGPSYANVSGTVTYNGKPIEKGFIQFSTDGRAPTQTDIVDGKYSGQAMVGSNKVQITADRKAAKEKQLPQQAQAMIKAYQLMGKGGTQTETVDPGMEDYIPPEWGSQ